ncbi:hypothetical protein L207DRAFT_529579 [Hyaloscypha variabilis F]|uniref:Uncharacterized protein n=1 Tax=Hyaloscypha variabilis (strain UAMH 11265 / GT02V1 / F) TaxID=1149755 RepID=A0A2J6RM97_HYAVF|nr:hypothetical protein L207DRAFT_529579 [Hyaloscypha variabilis F]
MLSAEEGSHDGIEFHDMYGDLSYDDDIPQFLRQAAVDESAGTGDSGFFTSALGLDMSAQHLESGRDVHQPSTIQVPTESMTFTFLAGDPDLAAIYIREGYLLKSQKRNRNSLQEIKVDGQLEEATTDNDETSEESAKDFDKNLDAACNDETDSISQMDSMEESSEDEKHQGAVGSDLEDDDTYPQPSAGPLRNPKLSLSTLKDLFKSNIISSERFVEYLALLSDNTGTWRDNPECKFAFDFSCSRYEAFFTSLRALVATSEVYKLLPSATIDLKILSQRLEDAEWIPESDCLSGSQLLLQPLRGLSLSLQETFACITMFETGIINLETYSFDNVMAISSGDAIFVAATLLCDPYECPQATEIRRIVGNVGRAGVSLLISPAQLRKEKQKISSWDCVTHEDFNGLAEDNFRSTSVHLSFTATKWLWTPTIMVFKILKFTILRLLSQFMTKESGLPISMFCQQ